MIDFSERYQLTDRQTDRQTYIIPTSGQQDYFCIYKYGHKQWNNGRNEPPTYLQQCMYRDSSSRALVHLASLKSLPNLILSVCSTSAAYKDVGND